MSFRRAGTHRGTAPFGTALLVLLGFCSAPAVAQMAEDLPIVVRMERLSLDEYADRLRALSLQLDNGASPAEIAAPIPPAWLVEREGQRTWIYTDWLTDALRDIEEDGADSGGAREALSARIASLVREANLVWSGEMGPAPDISARSHLDEILQRPEFGLVHKPSIWENLISRFQQWLDGIFDSLKEETADRLNWTRYLLWALIFALALLVLYYIVRNMHANAAEPMRPFPAPVKPDKDAAGWWREAREAARGGDWRLALHNGYWAIIFRLTEQARWPEDYSRTHREYLALLSGDSSLWRPAREATFRFERSWYGGIPAAESDFELIRSLWERLHADAS